MKTGDFVETRSLPTAARRVCRTLGLMLAISAGLAAVQPVSAADTDIRIALSAGIDQLDPARSANGPDMAIYSQIYETLLALDPKTGKLLPHLATSYTLKEPTL